MDRTTRFSVGAIELISLTDGTANFDASTFANATDDNLAPLLQEAGEDTIRTNFNAFLVKSGDRVLLVDTGVRGMFGETTGFLMEAMTQAGVTPAEVTDLFMTHLHPDHVAGAITEAGEAVFPNARMVVSDTEAAFWSDASLFRDDTSRQSQQLAVTSLAAYGDRTERLAGEADIVPGVRAIEIPGHTPGQMGFRIDDGGSSFVHFADLVHAPHIQFANPEISVIFDVDADQARATRRQMLDMLATDEVPCSGGHMLRPTLGRVVRHGSAYKFEYL